MPNFLLRGVKIYKVNIPENQGELTHSIYTYNIFYLPMFFRDIPSCKVAPLLFALVGAVLVGDSTYPVESLGAFKLAWNHGRPTKKEIDELFFVVVSLQR